MDGRPQPDLANSAPNPAFPPTLVLVSDGSMPTCLSASGLVMQFECEGGV
jgi:hypothetical protein